MPTKLINYDQCCGENDIFSRSSLRWLAIARVDPRTTLLITFIDQHFILMNWEDFFSLSSSVHALFEA
jgi:hypothetical protein